MNKVDEKGITFYSEEDECYIAIIPGIDGLSAFGDTPEDALKELKIAYRLWISTFKEE